MAFHALSADAALLRLKSHRDGLSDAEAARRLNQYGPNSLRATPPASAWKVLIDQLRSVVVVLLIVAAAVSAIVRDVPEAIAIGAVLLVNTLVGFFTELRARERSSERCGGLSQCRTREYPDKSERRAAYIAHMKAPLLLTRGVNTVQGV